MAELDTPQQVRQEIWGGTGSEPLAKRRVTYGPWQTREHALDEMCARLTEVEVTYHAGATPREVVSATLDGPRYHLRFGRGNQPADVLFVGQEYDLTEERRILLDHDISPRIRFGGQRWLVHATGMSTMSGPHALDKWMLIGAEPREDGRFMIPDGTGGTFTYEYDRAEGPFEESFELIGVMRKHSVDTVSDHYRTVSVEQVLDLPDDRGRAMR